jgi:hypothetical protein
MSSRLNMSLRIAVAGMLTVTAFSGCSDDDNGSGPPPGQEISLALDGFPVSTPEEGNYELWISFAGTGPRHDTAQSMGKFRVNADGQVVKPDGSPNPFEGHDHVWQLAVDSFITLEPAEDSDPGPSLPGIVAGDIVNRHATMDISGDDAIGFSFDTAAGSLILATPSTSDATDETEGIWFTAPSGTTGALTLPNLPMDGPWIYEAWTSNGVYGVASLGRFYIVNGPDDDGSGPLDGTGGRIDQLGYNFPGSDFPFDGLRLSLSPGEAFITIEPTNYADGLGPFILTVLQAQWGASSAGTPISMTNLSSSLPTASLSLPE